MRYLLLFLGLLVMPMAFAKDHPLTLVANTSVPITAPLTMGNIKDIYLLKQVNWLDNTPVVVINRKSNDSVRKIFERKLGLSSAKYALYLKKMHYKGVSLPIIQESKAAVLAFVGQVPGAIAYVEGEVPSEMKNIKIIGLLR